ncbi:hypothetical protein OC842_001363 [Tilletia horrida]|uniref:Uncharacterized protein n=1 Tax=Tilletia horrida TaxID=155126 RepID=A0AAN6GFS3_9BASI|nr:hypothetical protein OC842_001363 [Tilletia horrida]
MGLSKNSSTATCSAAAASAGRIRSSLAAAGARRALLSPTTKRPSPSKLGVRTTAGGVGCSSGSGSGLLSKNLTFAAGSPMLARQAQQARGARAARGGGLRQGGLGGGGGIAYASAAEEGGCGEWEEEDEAREERGRVQRVSLLDRLQLNRGPSPRVVPTTLCGGGGGGTRGKQVAVERGGASSTPRGTGKGAEFARQTGSAGLGPASSQAAAVNAAYNHASQGSTHAHPPPQAQGSFVSNYSSTSSCSSAIPSSDPVEDGSAGNSQTLDEALLGLEALSFAGKSVGGKTEKNAAMDEKDRAEHDRQHALEVFRAFSDEVETHAKEQFEEREEASRTAYMRITKLVKGVSGVSEAMHATFHSAVVQWQAYEGEVAELSDVLATAHGEILQQVNELVGGIRDTLNKMQTEKSRYEDERLVFFQSFRKKAKEQFSKYEAERDELRKVAAAVNDTKASEKQVRSTVTALIQSL